MCIVGGRGEHWILNGWVAWWTAATRTPRASFYVPGLWAIVALAAFDPDRGKGKRDRCVDQDNGQDQGTSGKKVWQWIRAALGWRRRERVTICGGKRNE